MKACRDGNTTAVRQGLEAGRLPNKASRLAFYTLLPIFRIPNPQSLIPDSEALIPKPYTLHHTPQNTKSGMDPDFPDLTFGNRTCQTLTPKPKIRHGPRLSRPDLWELDVPALGVARREAAVHQAAVGRGRMLVSLDVDVALSSVCR
jgi:hypothetical protein